MKLFSQWTKQDIEEEFGLTAVFDSPVLQSWLHDIQELSEEETLRLRYLSEKLRARVHDWNEAELKIYFIAFLLDFVDFYQPLYRPFLERELSVNYAEGKKLWLSDNFRGCNSSAFNG